MGSCVFHKTPLAFTDKTKRKHSKLQTQRRLKDHRVELQNRDRGKTMLNWDDYNSEDPIPVAVKAAPQPVEPAQPQAAPAVAEPKPVYADNAAIEKAAAAEKAAAPHSEPAIADADIAARAHAAVEHLNVAAG